MAAKAFIALGMAAVSAMGAIKAGNAQKAAADFEADQLRQQGERDQEIATQQAEEFSDRGARQQARIRALVAGGGGTLEGSALAVSSDVAAETAFQVERIKAGGDTAANRAENQATLRRFEGKEAQRASRVKAGTSLLTAASGSFGGFGGAA